MIQTTTPNQTVVPNEITRSLKIYHWIAVILRTVLILLGLIAIVASTFVTAYVDKEHFPPNVIQFSAFIATVSIALISSFGLSNKGNNARGAYRLLLRAVLLYKAGSISLEELIEEYAKAEALLGSVDFSFK